MGIAHLWGRRRSSPGCERHASGQIQPSAPGRSHGPWRSYSAGNAICDVGLHSWVGRGEGSHMRVLDDRLIHASDKAASNARQTVAAVPTERHGARVVADCELECVRRTAERLQEAPGTEVHVDDRVATDGGANVTAVKAST